MNIHDLPNEELFALAREKLITSDFNGKLEKERILEELIWRVYFGIIQKKEND